MVHVTTECQWCSKEIRAPKISIFFSFMAPKWCHKNCQDAATLAEEVSQQLAFIFKAMIRGENLGAVKSYPGYLEKMITWPDWSPRGEALRIAEAQKDQPPAP